MRCLVHLLGGGGGMASSDQYVWTIMKSESLHIALIDILVVPGRTDPCDAAASRGKYASKTALDPGLALARDADTWHRVDWAPTHLSKMLD